MRTAALVVAASLAAGAVDASNAPNFRAAGRGSVAAVDALLRRVLPKPHPFELKLVAGCAAPPPAAARSKLCFELGPGSAAGKVSLSGTSGVELARGAAHYLRRRCNMSFAWPRTGGNQVAAPADWPAVRAAETRYRTVEYSCTRSRPLLLGFLLQALTQTLGPLTPPSPRRPLLGLLRLKEAAVPQTSRTSWRAPTPSPSTASRTGRSFSTGPRSPASTWAWRMRARKRSTARPSRRSASTPRPLPTGPTGQRGSPGPVGSRCTASAPAATAPPARTSR